MTIKRAFVFPGQGSQHVGMGADAIDEWPQVERVLRQVETLSGHRIVAAMQRGSEDQLRDTVMAQLAVFGLSIALWQLLADGGIRPAVVAGHSLGEYSALVAGGWLDAEAAAVAVAHRAEAMGRCCRKNPGAMAAVVGVNHEAMCSLLEDIAGTVVVANANAPRQAVVSGDADAIEAMQHVVTEAGLGSVVPLPVAGAFHSSLMQDAQDELAEVIAELPLQLGHTPLISSITGEFVTDVETYRTELSGQITGPVRWVDTVDRLLQLPLDGVVEVGPGTVLRGLIRKVDRRQEVQRCAGPADLYALGLANGRDEMSLSA
jgi:[acyl-carrier-protein] S-malonyltransferase